MSLPYIKLEHEEAVIAKKSILSAEISALNIVKTFGEYNKLRKSEFSKRTMLKRAVKQKLAEINSLLREMPEVPGAFVKPAPSKEKQEFVQEITLKEESKKGKGIESELAEIREKLSKLNQ